MTVEEMDALPENGGLKSTVLPDGSYHYEIQPAKCWIVPSRIDPLGYRDRDGRWWYVGMVDGVMMKTRGNL